MRTLENRLIHLTRNDFRIDTFRGSGPGGQNRNKVSSGVRITHLASGAAVECCEERDQPKNRAKAFTRLAETPKFKAWLAMAIADALAVAEGKKTLEQRVDAQMAEENILVEYL